MLHKCKYCDYESAYRPNVKRHENNKHGVQEPTSHQHAQLKTSYVQGYPQLQPVHHGQVVHQQPVYHRQVDHQKPVHRGQIAHQQSVQDDGLSQDSMDTDSVDLDKESVTTDGEDEDEENVDNLNDLIKKIHYTVLDLKEMRDDYRKALEQVDTEQLGDVLENYADLEVAILDEQDGLDPEENGDGDDNVEEEGVDEKGGDEEKDTCTKCEKECILDFVFELRNVIQDDEKEKLENIIGEKKKEFLESKENENDDSDDEDVELNTKSDIIKKEVRNVESVINSRRREVNISRIVKIQTSNVCEKTTVMDDKLVCNNLNDLI